MQIIQRNVLTPRFVVFSLKLSREKLLFLLPWWRVSQRDTPRRADARVHGIGKIRNGVYVCVHAHAATVTRLCALSPSCTAELQSSLHAGR